MNSLRSSFRLSALLSFAFLALCAAPAARAQSDSPLALAVTATPSTVKPGELAQYAITAVNKGAAPLTGVQISFVAPTYLDGAGDPVTSPVFDLAPGQSRTEFFSYAVAAPVLDGTILRLSASAAATDGTSASAFREITVRFAPTLALDIGDHGEFAAPGSVAPRQIFNYVLTYGNRGTTAIANAQLRAAVPAGTTYAGSSDSGVLASGEVTWNLGALAPGVSGTRTLSVTADATPTNLLVADAEIFEQANPLNAARAADSTVVQTAPALGVETVVSPSTVYPGQEVQINVRTTNQSAAPLTGVRVSLVIPDYLSNAGTLAGSLPFDLAPGEVHSDNFTYIVRKEGSVPTNGTVIRVTARALARPATEADAAGPGADSSQAFRVLLPPAGTLQFSASNYTVNEGDGTATFTVNRVGGSYGAVSALYSFEDAGAGGGIEGNGHSPGPGADYIISYSPLINPRVYWEDGDTSPKTFSVGIVDDDVVEGPENFIVHLSPDIQPGGPDFGGPTQATVTIIDDDSTQAPAGTLQFSANAYTVNEGAGMATFTVTRVGGSGGRVSAVFATSDAGDTGNAKATANVDYTATNAVSDALVWEDGDTAPKTFTLPIINDGNKEVPEDLLLTLMARSDRTVLGTPTQAVLTIIDDDAPLPVVRLTASEASVVAGTGQSGAFLIERTGDASSDLLVSYAVKGSAVVGTDYARLRGKVKIKAGHNSAVLRVRPLGEGRGPGGKAVVKLSLLPGSAYAVDPAAPPAAKVKIFGQ